MSLYGDLGITSSSDSNEIRKAYLKLSKTEHPDKGGSEERFKKIQQAYEILSDDEKKQYYDSTGQIPGQGQEQGQGFPGGMPFDLGSIFGGMFGGGMHMGGMPGMPGMPGGHPGMQRQRRPKGPPKVHEIGLTLHDFFYGKTSQLKFQRQKFCEECKGNGATSFSQCSDCNGSGMRETRVMFGPGMQAIQRAPCTSCSAEGKRPDGVCSSCRGMKFKTHEKSLIITIEPGMLPGHVIQYSKECSDQHEYEEPGDVHIVLRENDDNLTFTRSDDDLTTVLTINLTEALLGCQRVLHGHPAHPNGLTVTLQPGTMRGDIVTVKGEGMPRRSNKQRGNLNMTIIVNVAQGEKEILSKNLEALTAILRG